MTAFKPIKEGKVREIYDNGDSLIMVATDRISAFDVILKNKVTKKGTVLTQMSKFWFDYTKDLLPNHMLSVDVKDMPEFFRQPQFDGNSMLCRKLTMLPIECIVRAAAQIKMGENNISLCRIVNGSEAGLASSCCQPAAPLAAAMCGNSPGCAARTAAAVLCCCTLFVWSCWVCPP